MTELFMMKKGWKMHAGIFAIILRIGGENMATNETVIIRNELVEAVNSPPLLDYPEIPLGFERVPLGTRD
mgnify:CR=1 FL=1